MNKRVPYTIIPKFFRTINDIDNEANIKVIYWKLKCEQKIIHLLSLSFLAALPLALSTKVIVKAVLSIPASINK